MYHVPVSYTHLPAAAATVIEGYQLTLKGKAGKALGLSLIHI